MSNPTKKDGQGIASNSSAQQNEQGASTSQQASSSQKSGVVLDERVSQVASDLIDQVFEKYNVRRGGHHDPEHDGTKLFPNAEGGEIKTQGGEEMDKANVNELTIRDLLALADCSDCVWDKNYHPCLLDGPEDNEKCKEEMRRQGYDIPHSKSKPGPPKEVQESASKTVKQVFPKEVQKSSSKEVEESPSKKGAAPTNVVPSKEAVQTNEVKDSKTNLPRTRSSSTGKTKSGTASRVNSKPLGRSIHSGTISTSKLYDFSDSSRTKIHDANCPTKKYYDAEGYSNSKSSIHGSKSTSRTKFHGSKNPSQSKIPDSKNPSQSKIPNSKNPSQSKITDSKNPSQSKISDSKNPSQSKIPDSKSPSKSKTSDSKSAPSKPIIHEKPSKSTPNADPKAESSKPEARASDSHHVQFKKEPKPASSKAIDHQPQNPNSSQAEVHNKNDKHKGPPDDTLEYINKLHPHAKSHAEDLARDNLIPLPFELPKREESQSNLAGKLSSHRNIHGRNSRFNPPERPSLVHQPPSTIDKQDVVCGTDKPCNFVSANNKETDQQDAEPDGTTIKELYSLANGKACGWNKNYHPCSNKLNPKDVELCKQWKESNGIKGCKSSKNASISKSKGSNAQETSVPKEDGARSSKSSRSNSKTSK